MSELPISGSYRPTIMGTNGHGRRRDTTSRRWPASASSRAGAMPSTPAWPPASATCVLQIDMVDLAGVAPIIIYLAEQDRVLTISGLGRWPRAASVEYFKSVAAAGFPLGVQRCITPGCARCLDHGARGVRHDEPGARSWRRPSRSPSGASPCILHGRQSARKAPQQIPSSGRAARPSSCPAGGRRRPARCSSRRTSRRTMRRLVAAEARARGRGRDARARGGARSLLPRRDRAGDRRRSIRSRRRAARPTTIWRRSTRRSRSRCASAFTSTRSTRAVRGVRGRCSPRR